MTSSPFLSIAPRVRLIKSFSHPVRNAVAAARTCYSSRGIVREESLEDREKTLELASSVFQAGHHTVFQHAHFQFAIENVSRQFLWSFLHAHPFYNSEQVSQRYVAVLPNAVAMPRLPAPARAVYERCVRRQFDDYKRLCAELEPVVAEAYYERFLRSPSQEKRHTQSIAKKAQEVARYVLPVATHAYLVHTVSALTVLRYYRLSRQMDAPAESELVAAQMMKALIDLDPDFEALAAHPLEPESLPESAWVRQGADLFGAEARVIGEQAARRFVEEFDRDFERLGPRRPADTRAAMRRRALEALASPDLFPGELREALGLFQAGEDEASGIAKDGGSSGGGGEKAGGHPPDSREGGDWSEFHHSRLVAWQSNAERVLARCVRQVLGLPARALPDEEAIALVLDPRRNTLLGDTLNLATLHKLSRALYHPHYTFMKRISHTADSQDQRHRMSPASRPYLTAHLTGRPDYLIPALVERSPRAMQIYNESMEQTWEAIRYLRARGTEEQWTAYLLPNAVLVRFTESSDLLNLHHKHKMRLCYTSQDEIWRATLEEARQIAQVHPRLGRWLLPPCALRQLAGAKPYCPEGSRYCGVRVWTLDPHNYTRRI